MAEIEYLLVADQDSKVLLSTTDRKEALRLLDLIRRAGGEATLFKATKD